MSTIRQQLIDKIDARLKTVLILNGYVTNIGTRVYEWKDINIPADALPCLIFRDVSCDVTDDSDEYYHTKSLSVEIDIKTAAADAPEDLRNYLKDILKAIGTDLGWDDLAYNTRLTGDAMEIDHKNRKFGGMKVSISIIYYVKKWED
jgi:hypothetical protein